MNATERTELAEKLHNANRCIVSAKRDVYANPASAQTSASNASAILKDVIATLMDAPGVTDFYGNPTCRECEGPLEVSPWWPNAGYLHACDSDDTHKPVI